MDKDSDPTPITIINGQKQNHLASENDDLTLYDAGFPVVGIGASAGGLDVFKRFFIAMPADSGMAFVLVQHLDPTHDSMMSELLSKHTEMPVVQIDNGMRLQPNTVYMIPPNTYTFIIGAHLFLKPPIERRGLRLPIDYLFTSMAGELGERSICIILSGTGADGTLGLRAIKSAGGTAFVQEPESAQYDGMPSSAIATELVDFVLPVEKIPSALINYVAHTQMYASDINNKQINQSNTNVDQIRPILSLLDARTNHNFQCYKKGTLTRRIQRRMGLSRKKTYKDYLILLRKSDAEIQLLLKDLLIGVTAFFRDPESWQILSKRVLHPLISDKAGNEPIRIWLPGCSSGEEAYTMAILIVEIQEKIGNRSPVQIFASDIDEVALERARVGLYPKTISSDIPPKRLKKYFTAEGDRYRANKRIRDMVVFAAQNLISDPPFSKVDIVSCRNLLIYFDANIQKKVISLFHFALSENGYLFLGPSEALSGDKAAFETLDKKWRIFRRLGGGNERYGQIGLPLMASTGQKGIHPKNYATSSGKAKSVKEFAHDILLHEYAPASIILNRAYEAIYYYGPVSQYLQVTTGEPTRHIVDMVRDGMKIKVRSALQRAMRENKVVTAIANMRNKSDAASVTVTARPLHIPPPNEGLVLLTFEDIIDPIEVDISTLHVTTNQQNSEELKQLEYELTATREDLQSTVEEMETSNEELKASNEEIMSMNEELQSTNEELETSKEELQSLNEELITVNSQLQDKVGDLESVNDDLSNLLNSTDIATLFLDRDFNVRRFTPSITHLFRLIPSDVGRHVDDIALRFKQNKLFQHAHKVLKDLQPHEQIVHSEESHDFLCRIIPYRTVTDRIGGLVITFVDITDRIANETKLAQAKLALEYDKGILTAVMNGANNSHLAYLDYNFNFVDVNQVYLDYCRHSHDYLMGKNYFLFNDSQQCKAIFTQVRDTGVAYSAFNQPRIQNPNQPLAVSYWDWTLSPVFNSDGNVEGLVLALHETTERKLVEDELRLATKVFEQSAEGIMVTDTDMLIIRVNQAFSSLTGYSAVEAQGKSPSFLNSGKHDKDFYDAMWQKINTEGKWQGELWNRRKSGETYPEWLSISKVINDDGELVNYVGIFSDISVMKNTMDRVTHLASHDELTGLSNRTVFTDRVNTLITKHNRSPQHFAILFLDLDDFKKINDTKGHSVGDEVLVSIAERLCGVIREQDTVARFGGDEFVILMVETNEYLLHKTLARIQQSLTNLKTSYGEQSISTSIGISLFPSDGTDTDTLLSHADNAMYNAKRTGKNRFNFFSHEQYAEIGRRIAIEQGLKNAIENDSLELHYQPQWELSSQKICGLEALLRWESPELGVVSPAEFIPIAEETNLISELGEWVINSSCSQLAQWRDLGYNDIYVSINVSPAQFTHSHIPNIIQLNLNRHLINAKYITVEITESAIMLHQDKTQSILKELHDIGVGLSIDDFGTGYSSLARLKHYPLSELKIDKSFIDNICKSKDDLAITETIIAMSKTLQLKVVAEGIETQQQLETLLSLGCQIGQGYLLHKPLPANEVIKLFEKRNQGMP